MNSGTKGIRIGFALTGSFCTLDSAVEQMEILRAEGNIILPVISFNVRDTDSRFGTAAYWRKRIAEAADTDEIIDSITAAEPIGPKDKCDIMLIAPCTGNTMAKMANGVVDTPVLMAAKSHLRNGRPLVIAVATNDGLSGNAKSLGTLMNYRHMFFVPFCQDNPGGKPNSLIADMSRIPQTIKAAMEHRQIPPILACKTGI